MPYVLEEEIHYNPTDTHDALDKIRQFAISLGWTVDTWVSGNPSQLQIWSPGYVHQELCYRLQVTNVDAQEQTLSYQAVRQGYRVTGGFSLSTSYTWGGVSTAYYNTSLPATTFDALYLFGTKRFISAIFHVDPIAVITLQLGTWDLMPSWWYYPGLNFHHNPEKYWGVGAGYKWYNIASNPDNWSPPMTQRRSNTQGRHIWYDGEARDQGNYACNFRPNSNSALGAEAGEFNKAIWLCSYNDYTDKRMAFQSTFFVKDPTAGVWYPVGVSPFAWVNGRGLNIGEVIKFGSDEYRCFPGVYTLYEQWQAYRIL